MINLLLSIGWFALAKRFLNVLSTSPYCFLLSSCSYLFPYIVITPLISLSISLILFSTSILSSTSYLLLCAFLILSVSPPLIIYFPISLPTSLYCYLLPDFCYQLRPSYLLPSSHHLLSHLLSTPPTSLSAFLLRLLPWFFFPLQAVL